MNDLVLQPRFIRPFSRGQITLPKDYRDHFGIDDKVWLKISLLDDQILIQPVKEMKEPRTIKPKISRETYLKKLLKIKGKWFNEKEIEEVRAEFEQRLAKNGKSLA